MPSLLARPGTITRLGMGRGSVDIPPSVCTGALSFSRRAAYVACRMFPVGTPEAPVPRYQSRSSCCVATQARSAEHKLQGAGAADGPVWWLPRVQKIFLRGSMSSHVRTLIFLIPFHPRLGGIGASQSLEPVLSFVHSVRETDDSEGIYFVRS